MSLIENKEIGRNYDIIDKFECGLKLQGFEVKSLRAKHGSLKSSYVIIRGGEAFVINFYIPPYQPKNSPKDYDPYMPRKLLVTRKELLILEGLSRQKGLTLVPISVYNEGRNLKITVGVGRGKKIRDKREQIKKRDSDREVRREFKDR